MRLKYRGFQAIHKIKRVSFERNYKTMRKFGFNN